MRVLKFGGAALRDGDGVRRAAGIVRARQGRLLVVVSAHEGVTALLRRAVEGPLRGRDEWDALRIRHRTLLRQLGLPGDLLDRHLYELRTVLEARADGETVERRLRDFVLSFGERMSARVFAAVLRREGAPATPLDAYDLGLVSDGGLLERPDGGSGSVGRSLLAVPGIPVVTGFLALDVAGHLTTLGRNGSDLSAVWFGEAVGAEEVQLWKTVGGVMTADPKLVENATVVPRLSWSEAETLAAFGSEIVHPRALEPARRAGLCVRVLGVLEPSAAGTRIEGEALEEGPRGIAHRPRVALLRREGLSAADLAAFFRRLDERSIEVFGAEVRGGELTALLPDLPEVAELAAGGTGLTGGLSSVAVVGAGVRDHPALARSLRRAEHEGIALREAPGGARTDCRAVLCPRADMQALVERLHRDLFEALPSERPSIAAG